MEDEPAVAAMWQQCGPVTPQNDPHEDIARKMAFQPDLFFVGVSDSQIVATVMAGYEGHRGWINYLAVAPAYQRRGIGRALYARLLHDLCSSGYASAYAGITLPNEPSVGFHLSMGFEPIGVFPRVGWKLGAWHDVAWYYRPLAGPVRD